MEENWKYNKDETLLNASSGLVGEALTFLKGGVTALVGDKNSEAAALEAARLEQERKDKQKKTIIIVSIIGGILIVIIVLLIAFRKKIFK